MRPQFKAFHGQQDIKDKYIARMKGHMAADELIQGTGYRDGKGCAVGCTLNNYSHIAYEDELGIPFTIAIYEDNIFEALSKENSLSFPLEFLEAVPVGADLSNVYNQMEVWLLTDETYGLITKMKTDDEKKIVTDLAALHTNVINGIDTTEEQWKAVYYRADLAYRADRAYLADLADRAYLADLADRADLAYLAYRAYLADLADRADLAYLAYRADRAYLAYRAYRADAMRAKFIELIKATPATE